MPSICPAVAKGCGAEGILKQRRPGPAVERWHGETAWMKGPYEGIEKVCAYGNLHMYEIKQIPDYRSECDGDQ